AFPSSVHAAATTCATGPDGNLWFVSQSGGGYIARVVTGTTPALSVFPVATSGAMTALAADALGHLWITDPSDGVVYRVSP
ncbi:MAG TPA: hypothetical protein VMF61_12535, partial [Candidatus Acidoferrales bacterium]|nr:hypothetical protein [Candidatus Acidoferrales bacterium]